MKRISIRMKTTKDTRRECSRRRQEWMPYFQGRTKPHFPVPALFNHLHTSPLSNYLFMKLLDNYYGSGQ